MECIICKKEYRQPTPDVLKRSHYNWENYCSSQCWVNDDFKCHHSGEHLTKEDWEEIMEKDMPGSQYYKICNTNYAPKKLSTV